MKKMTTLKAVVINELILTPTLTTVRGHRLIEVRIDNCPREDLPILRPIADIVAAWLNETWEG